MQTRRRREFMELLGGMSAWPLSARAPMVGCEPPPVVISRFLLLAAVARPMVARGEPAVSQALSSSAVA
jgi:hypothetical protein